MKEFFLIAALALPGNFYHFGAVASQYEGERYTHENVGEVPASAKPHWDFGPPEVKIVRLLRDYANGTTASRPHAWVLIYGRHPLWVHLLRDAQTKVIGMYRQKLSWPGYIVADPLQTPFRDRQFQVYLYDDFMPAEKYLFAIELSRIVAPPGFFLYRYTKDGDFAKQLEQFDWRRFEWDFHEFTIWWRPKNFPREIVQATVYRPGWKRFDPLLLDRLSDWLRKLRSAA